MNSFVEGNIYYQTVCQIQIKVLLMAFVANGLQKDSIDNGYNNTWEYNHNQLYLRFNDYIVYYRKYNEFKTSNKNVRENIENNAKIRTFILPSYNGEKIKKDLELFNEDVHIILIPMTELYPLHLYYNIIDYYFNKSFL